LRISKELERRKNSNLSKNHIPNGKAAEFIKMVGMNETFVSMMIGANSTSKTATGANILANLIYGVQNKYFDYPIFQKWPYIKKGRIISDPTTIKEKIIPELEKWFPKNEAARLPKANYETAKQGKNYISKFKSNTGWEFDIMSNEQDVKEFESVDLGFVWIDEPMPKDRFMATIARGRLGMIIWWSLTPLTYSAWIKDWRDNNPDLVDYVEAEMEDNCKIHGVRGILEHKYIQIISDAFPEDERQARVFGKFGHLIGRVHKGFKRKIHVVKPFPIDERRFTTYMALDPHPRVDDHVLYMSVDKNNTKYFTAELLSDGLVKLLYERMKALEIKMKFRIENRLIDPAGYIDDQHKKEKSVGSELFDLGMNFIKGSKDLMAGIKKTNEALDYELKQGKMFRAPEAYIFDTCIVFIKQIDEYVWSEHKGAMKDEKQPKGRPKDINDHQVENMHRLLLHNTPFIPYSLRRSSAIPHSSFNPDPYD